MSSPIHLRGPAALLCGAGAIGNDDTRVTLITSVMYRGTRENLKAVQKAASEVDVPICFECEAEAIGLLEAAESTMVHVRVRGTPSGVLCGAGVGLRFLNIDGSFRRLTGAQIAVEMHGDDICSKCVAEAQRRLKAEQ